MSVECLKCGNELQIYCALGTKKPTSREQELLAGIAELRKDAERYRYIRDNQFNHIHITRNDNAASYETAKSWIEECTPEWFKQDPENEVQKMKDCNVIWTVQIYPDTPIGFYVFNGATLDNVVDRAIDAAMQQTDKEVKG